MEEIKKTGWGGARKGAGRPRTSMDGTVRKGCSLRASVSEWELIKEFAAIVKKDPKRAKRILKTE